MYQTSGLEEWILQRRSLPRQTQTCNINSDFDNWYSETQSREREGERRMVRILFWDKDLWVGGNGEYLSQEMKRNMGGGYGWSWENFGVWRKTKKGQCAWWSEWKREELGNEDAWDFPGSPGVKIAFKCIAWGVSSWLGDWGPTCLEAKKSEHTQQKLYCNKANKDFKNSPHQKKKS